MKKKLPLGQLFCLETKLLQDNCRIIVDRGFGFSIFISSFDKTERLFMLRRLPTIQTLLVLLALLAPVAVIAQDGLYVGDDTLYISTGEVLHVEGDVENDATGYLENRGTIVTRSSLVNNARMPLVPGQVRMEGTSPQTITMGGDSLHTLILNMGGSVNVVANDPIFIEDSLGLLNGFLQTTSTNIARVWRSQGVSPGNSLSFVNGPLEVQATNDTIYYPIGHGFSFRPVALNSVTIGGVAPVVRFECVAGATGGYDSTGIGILNNTRYWVGSVTEGDYTGSGNISIDYGFDDQNTFAFNPVVGNSQVVNAGYGSLGVSATTYPAASGTIVSQTMPAGASLGYFVLGECRYISGSVVASADTHCIGQPANVLASGYESTGDYYWMASTDSTTYTPIPGTNSQLLYLSDTLSDKTFYQFVVQGGGCRADTSNWARIVTRDPNRLRVRAIVQGAYHFVGDSMFYADGQGLTGGLNDPTIGEAMLLTDNFQYPMGTGLQDTTMYPGYTVPDSAVDIVRVELWADSNSDLFPDTKVDSTWGWVTKNGYIINFFNGQNDSPVFFCESQQTDYFVIVKHRNHLPAMSNTAVTMTTAGNTLLDLTTAAQAYTSSFAMVELQPAKYGMWAGDIADMPAFGDIYFVDANDFFEIFDASSTPLGNLYSRRDANLDGDVNSADFNIVSRNNDNFVSSPAPY